MKESKLPPEFDQIFGNLNRPPKELTPEQEAGLAFLTIVNQFKSHEEKKN